MSKNLGVNTLRGYLQHVPLRLKVKYFTLLSLKAIVSILDVFGIALIGFLAYLLGAQIQGTKEVTVLDYRFDISSQPIFISLLICIFLSFILKATFSIILTKKLSKAVGEIDQHLSNQVTNYFVSPTSSKILETQKSLVHFGIGDSSSQDIGLLLGLSSIISDGVVLALTFILFLAVDPMASLAVLIYFGILGVILHFAIGYKQRKLTAQLVQSTVNLSASIEDTYQSFREIFVSRKISEFRTNILGPRHKLSDVRVNQYFLGTLPKALAETALMIGITAFIIWQLQSGNLDYGLAVVGVFLAGGVRILGALLPLQASIFQYRNALVHGTYALEILNSSKANEIEQMPSSGLQTHTSSQSIEISASGLEFKFNDSNNPVIRQVHIQIKQGKFAAIIGPSGAGKTTLVDLILGIKNPTAGEVLLSGLSPLDFLDKYPNSVSYVPQKPGLISGTFAENIALGDKSSEINEAKVHEVCRLASLEKVLAKLENGIETVIGPGFTQLSGGELQRLGIARALYRSPKLIVLDEATSALDAESESEINSTIESIRGELTLLVVAHRLSTVQNADLVFLMEDGQVTDSGTLNELRKRRPLVEKYVSLMKIR